MRYWTRREGSNRSSVVRDATIEPIFSGQDGYDFLTFRINGAYHMFRPETVDDVRELQRQAAILAQNFREPR